MYRQPENNNRVKYMKNRFERLDLDKNNRVDVKSTKIINKTNEKNINNNDYKNNIYQRNDIHDDITKNDNKNTNLSRQLSDPSKKGCIKRTPAFRKEKFVNSRFSNHEISSDKDFLIDESFNCDNLPDNFKETKKLKSSVSLVMNKPTNIGINTSKRVSLSPKSAPNKSTLYNLKKPPMKIDYNQTKKSLSSDFDNSSSVVINRSPKTDKVELKMDNEGVSSSVLIKKSPKLTRSPLVSTKYRDKQNSFANSRQTAASFIKEMIDNETNLDFEKKSDVPIIPEYAQVDKNKKKDKYPENLTDTLKAALKQPLPQGPPPKKPPRTFAHVQKSSSTQPNLKEITEKINTELKLNDKHQGVSKKVKSDPKVMLQKLESALLNNKLRSPKLPKKIQCSLENSNLKNAQIQPNVYTTHSNKGIIPNCLSSLNCVGARESYSQCPTLDSKSTFFVNEEPIYAEPFEYQVVENNPESLTRTGTISRSVHYLVSFFIYFYQLNVKG